MAIAGVYNLVLFALASAAASSGLLLGWQGWCIYVCWIVSGIVLLVTAGAWALGGERRRWAESALSAGAVLMAIPGCYFLGGILMLWVRPNGYNLQTRWLWIFALGPLVLAAGVRALRSSLAANTTSEVVSWPEGSWQRQRAS